MKINISNFKRQLNGSQPGRRKVRFAVTLVDDDGRPGMTVHGFAINAYRTILCPQMGRGVYVYLREDWKKLIQDHMNKMPLVNDILGPPVESYKMRQQRERAERDAEASLAINDVTIAERKKEW